jgi:hypothetical protein
MSVWVPVTRPRPRLSIAAALGAALAFLGATPAAPQISPVGPERQINDVTPDFQQQAAVAADAGGRFVVVWSSSFEPALLGDCCQTIQARRFGADGAPLGGQFQVSTGTTSYQLDPAIAADTAGGFVVAWTSQGSAGTDTDFLSVQARRFDGAGAPLGDRFQVNTYTTDGQYSPSIATDATGAFVVAWTSQGSSGSDASYTSIQARLFEADGDPAGAEFQVNSYTSGAQHLPVVARRPSGEFVVAWLSYGSPGDDDDWSIQARRFDATGVALGDQFQVNVFTSGTQFRPAVASAGDGGFLVTWDSQGSFGDDTTGESIQARRFASDGTPAGPEIQVNSHAPGAQLDPALARAADDSFVVTWSSATSPGDDTASDSVQARRLDGVGSPLGDQFQVNTFTPSAQRRSGVAAAAGGRLLVAWESLDESEPETDLFGQAFTLALFADGFESGGTGAWSAVFP